MNCQTNRPWGCVLRLKPGEVGVRRQGNRRGQWLVTQYMQLTHVILTRADTHAWEVYRRGGVFPLVTACKVLRQADLTAAHITRSSKQLLPHKNVLLGVFQVGFTGTGFWNVHWTHSRYRPKVCIHSSKNFSNCTLQEVFSQCWLALEIGNA